MQVGVSRKEVIETEGTPSFVVSSACVLSGVLSQHGVTHSSALHDVQGHLKVSIMATLHLQGLLNPVPRHLCLGARP